MAKKVEGYIKLQIPAGKATPAPPVGPALGQHGVHKTVQCKNSRSGRFNHPCSNYRICGQKLQLRNKDSAGTGIDQEGMQHQIRFCSTAEG